jgi:multiple sugar transport system ATP-binding protein
LVAEAALLEVCKSFPSTVRALDGLTLHVADGELLVLIGASGSGKTTTLRLLAGLESPTSGTVHIAGRDVTRVPPYRRNVAFVFQRPALYPHLCVRENLLFGQALRSSWWRWLGRRSSVSGHQLDEVVQMLHLEEFLDRRPAELSGGQQQRVVLGRALLRRPGIFLLDEPLAHLDPPLRLEMRRDLHLLQRRLRATICYVTHDQDEAMALGDRVAVLDRGKLLQVDRPAVLYEQPVHLRVAQLLGSPPINLLDGLLIRCSAPGGVERLYFQAGGWLLPVAPPRERWQAFAGVPVTLGLRAEQVRPPIRERDLTRFTMEVALVERLGPFSLVTLVHDNVTLTARWMGDPPREGTATDVDLHLEQSLLFDRATGKTLE